MSQVLEVSDSKVDEIISQVKNGEWKYKYNACFDKDDAHVNIFEAKEDLSNVFAHENEVEKSWLNGLFIHSESMNIQESLNMPEKSFLNKKEEKILFAQMNYAKHKVFISANKDFPNINEIISWYKISMRIRNILIYFNMPLVLKTISLSKMYQNPRYFDQMKSEAFRVLVLAVDGFDVYMGFAFSTYAIRSMKSQLNRTWEQMKKHHDNEANEDAQHNSENAGKNYNDEIRIDIREMISDILNGNLLSDIEKKTFELRIMPILSGDKPAPYIVVGKEIGVSKDTAREIFSNALEIIREKYKIEDFF